MTLYGLFRFLHIVFAIAAMGPHFATGLMFRHMAKNPESAPTLLPVIVRISNFPKHGGMAMLLTGLLMVPLHPAGYALFKQPWLAASLILFIFTAAYGSAKLEPMAKELTAAMGQGPVKAEQVTAMTQRMNAGSNLMTLTLVAIIVLMVLRPSI